MRVSISSCVIINGDGLGVWGWLCVPWWQHCEHCPCYYFFFSFSRYSTELRPVRDAWYSLFTEVCTKFTVLDALYDVFLSQRLYDRRTFLMDWFTAYSDVVNSVYFDIVSCYKWYQLTKLTLQSHWLSGGRSLCALAFHSLNLWSVWHSNV